MGTGDRTGNPHGDTGEPHRRAPTATAEQATVERLRAEVAALRRAARRRSVIDQASGLLAERFGCDVDEAYEHLLRLAQDSDVSPEDAAALLLGAALPAVEGADHLRGRPHVFDPCVYLTAAGGTQPPAAVLLRDRPEHAPPHAPGLEAAPGADDGAAWLRALLEAIPDPAALLSPVRDGAGRLVDFAIDACNAEATDAAGRRPEGLVGRRVMQTYPGLADSGLLEAYVRVLETGTPLRQGGEADDDRDPLAPAAIRVCRLGGGLLVSWRLTGDAENLATQLRQAQRLGNLGWSVWNLADNRMSWSHQLYTIFGRDPAHGPYTIDQLAERVLPDDLPIAENVMRSLLEKREAVDTEFRIRRGDEVRRLRMMAEPVLGPMGEPTALRSVYQDVTGRRRIEQALAASREQLERQRLRIEDERNMAVEFQRSVLPLPSRFVEKPGLRAAVRYLPAGSAARVGGDWYETTAIDSGGVFLAIGDASGHGLKAAAAMARLRNALSGLAFTGAPPDELLGWLNLVVLHWPNALTATVVAARYDPESRTLRWAQGGHLPPVLVRDGEPEFLDPPEGVLLGAQDAPEFATQTLRLAAGDLLLLYTDGLVERRGRDIGVGLDRLLEAARGCVASDPDQCVEHVLRELGAPNPNDDTCLVAVQIT